MPSSDLRGSEGCAEHSEEELKSRNRTQVFAMLHLINKFFAVRVCKCVCMCLRNISYPVESYNFLEFICVPVLISFPLLLCLFDDSCPINELIPFSCIIVFHLLLSLVLVLLFLFLLGWARVEIAATLHTIKCIHRIVVCIKIVIFHLTRRIMKHVKQKWGYY